MVGVGNQADDKVDLFYCCIKRIFMCNVKGDRMGIADAGRERCGQIRECDKLVLVLLRGGVVKVQIV